MRELVAGKGDVELDAGDPPPDLVVEVDITSPSLDKLPIYVRLGVTEVWRYNGGRLVVLGLAGEDSGEPRYAEASESTFLRGVDVDALSRVIVEGLTTDRRVWRRRVRESMRGSI